MTKVGDVLEGKYRFLKELGHGGMAHVFLVYDCRLQKEWAAKEIKRDIDKEKDGIKRQSLKVETHVLKRLDHPALPRVVDCIETEEKAYLIMDYIRGRTLDEYLRDQKQPPSEMLLMDWAKQLCDVLFYLHSQNPPIIFRDLKPSNIMITEDGFLKLIDFGIAFEAGSQEKLNYALGTAGYAAPELYANLPADARTDIYSLGRTILTIGAKCDLSDAFYSLLERCTKLDPKKRYPNCKILKEELTLLFSDEKDMKKNREKTGTFRRRATLFFAVIFVLMILAFSVNGFARQRRYEACISTAEASDDDIRLSNYKEAIRLNPKDPRGYKKILEVYEERGSFTPTDSEEFLSVYNQFAMNLPKQGNEVAELYYFIGRMYFHLYRAAEGEDCFSERVQKACPFFEEALLRREDGFLYDEVLTCDTAICRFYKTYIFNCLDVSEVTLLDYERLLDEIRGTKESLKGVSLYERLSYDHCVFCLLYDQRASLCDVQVNEDEVLDLFDEAVSDAKGMTVEKEVSVRLRDEILDHCEMYRSAIVHAYQKE